MTRPSSVTTGPGLNYFNAELGSLLGLTARNRLNYGPQFGPHYGTSIWTIWDLKSAKITKMASFDKRPMIGSAFLTKWPEMSYFNYRIYVK